MTRVLVTGASGFVGRALCDVLVEAGYTVRGAFRNVASPARADIERVQVGEINGSTDWVRALEGVDHVVHLAARVHVLHDRAGNSPLYAETNAYGTQRLAEAASRADVQRFLYVSSIKVNGEETGGTAYTALDEPHPKDAYGASKLLAERLLSQVTVNTSLQAAIVRPPLVYGPGVRANFLRLMSWVEKGWPLPLGAVRNQRSLVSVWNLCDLLRNLLVNAAAPGRTWLVSDGADLSTADLIRRIASAMNRRAMLFPMPTGALFALGALIGRRSEVERLCGSLVVDTRATRRDLGWTPPVGVDESIARTVAWYQSQRQSDGR